MNIDWNKQPEGFPLWLEGTNEEHRKHSGWYRRAGQVFEGSHGGQWRSVREGQFFTVHERPDTNACADGGLPPLESTVRIVPGETIIWDVAEQFVGVDCRLKAVFMLDETQMVAVEGIESGQCCCFWASMVRTPGQAEAEEREAGIENLLDWVAAHTKVDRAEVYRKNWSVLYDAGLRPPVKP